MTGATTRRLPTSLLWVGGGIGVYGLSSFAFLSLAARGLGNGADYAALSVMWALINAVGIGLYLPLEQHGGRAVTARRTRGLPTRPALRGPLVWTGASLGVLALVALVLDDLLTERIFEGVPHMGGVLVLGLAGMSVAYLARGVLAGTGRFPRYGVQLTADGLLRVVGAAALAATGTTDARAYGVVLGLAPLVATVLALVGSRPLLTTGTDDTQVREPGMVALVAASLASQALANVGPVAAQLLRGPDETQAAADLVNALTVARIPLFVFAAVQAVFLPRLAALAASDDRAGFVQVLRLAGVATTAIGALGVAVMAMAGPQAVRLLFGPEFAGRTEVLVLIAASAAVFMVAQVLVQALLARRADGVATLAWCVGLVALLVALLPTGDVQVRVSAAMTVGSCAALVVAAAGVVRSLGRWPAPQTQKVAA